MNGRCVVGLIGYGYWGPNLLRNYMELPSAEVKWVCDKRPGRLELVRTRFPSVHVTDRCDDLFEDPDVDAVLIATPISTHLDIAERALLSGKHVFVEKPMAASVAEAEALVELADQRNLTLMVGHTFEYSPPVVKIKELIKSGELGDIYYVMSTRVNLGLHQHDVSVIWDLAPHDFSILFDWLDEEPTHITTVGRACVKQGIPDVAFVTLRFPSSAVAECQFSWLSPVKLRRTIIVGSQKMLLYDDTETVETVKVFDHGVNIVEPGSFGEFQLSYRTGDILSPRIDSAEPLKLEATHFVDSIRNGTRPKTDGQSGLRVVRALERAQASLDVQGCNRRCTDVARPEVLAGQVHDLGANPGFLRGTP